MQQEKSSLLSSKKKKKEGKGNFRNDAELRIEVGWGKN